jgi:tRNA pseudouridine55 synthase
VQVAQVLYQYLWQVLIVECGKGTYIRTLATDIGKALGLPAHMSKLTRTQRLSVIKICSIPFKPYSIGNNFSSNVSCSCSDFISYKAEFKQNIDDIVIMVDNETHKVLAIYEPHPEKLFSFNGVISN